MSNKGGPQSFSFKELNSANNLHGSEVPPDQNAELHLDFSLSGDRSYTVSEFLTFRTVS